MQCAGREGIGMPAWALICLILGIIGAGTVGWICYNIGVPMWQDRRRNRSRTYSSTSDGHPLQETPSTATPSP